MGSDWESIRIDSLKASDKGSIAIGPFGSRMKSDCYVESGIPVIRGTNIIGSRNLDGNFVFITKEKADSLGSSNVYKGDLVFPHRGSIGEVGIIESDSRFVISSSLMKLTCDKSKAYPTFIYYFFKSHLGKYELLKNASQVGTPGIGQPLSSLKSINLQLPPLPEQKAIAHILGSLDDKIELNRQMNETLESMAQALFKSWFVDFDPVIDNALAEGNAIPDVFAERAEQRRNTKQARRQKNGDIIELSVSKNETASSLKTGGVYSTDLFPSEFEYTEEMGWIPKGWGVKQIEDVADVIKGRSYKSSELEASKTALVTLKSFKRGGGYRLDGLKEYTGTYREDQKVFAGDLVIAYTDVTQAADVIGKPAMVISDSRYDYLVISLDVAVVRPHDSLLKYYLYGLAETRGFQEHTHSHATGTTVLHLAKNAVPDYLFCKPSGSLLEVYEKIVKPQFISINNNIETANNISKLRDTLLPKLLSGELRIPDAEKLIEEAQV